MSFEIINDHCLSRATGMLDQPSILQCNKVKFHPSLEKNTFLFFNVLRN
jgi:hypothetical protein